MRRRKVVEQEHMQGGLWRLKLECDHVVVRRRKKRDPPKASACEFCKTLLERCDEQQGWFDARSVGGTRAALQLLVDEGILDVSRSVRATTIHYKRMRR